MKHRKAFEKTYVIRYESSSERHAKPRAHRFYQLNIPEVYRHWHFNQRFSDHRELRDYMAHIDKVLDLRKDTTFDARVSDASWDQALNKWTIKTQQGHVAQAKYLISCTGLLHRTYTPDFPGLKEYKGEIYHSGAWPEDFEGNGKKIAIIGAGATAVQITQELGKRAKEMTVFLRRPSYCLPMGQRAWTAEEQRAWKTFYPRLFKEGRNSFAGFPCDRQPLGIFDVDEKEREAWFEDVWQRGGFNFALANYNNISIDKDANAVSQHLDVHSNSSANEIGGLRFLAEESVGTTDRSWKTEDNGSRDCTILLRHETLATRARLLRSSQSIERLDT